VITVVRRFVVFVVVVKVVHYDRAMLKSKELAFANLVVDHAGLIAATGP